MSGIETRTHNAGMNHLATPHEQQEVMYGQCCCCRLLPSIKSLWSEYEWMGRTEVYGNMLLDCFNIQWPQTENTQYQICEVCITQLRNALQFKSHIMQSYTGLFDAIEPIKEVSETIDADTGAHEMHTETYVCGDNPHEDVLHNDIDHDEDATHHRHTPDDNTPYQLTTHDGHCSVEPANLDVEPSPEDPSTEKVCHRAVADNHRKEKEKKHKRSRRSQMVSPDTPEVRDRGVTPTKMRHKDRHTEFRCNSVLAVRYEDVSSQNNTEDVKKEAAEQTNTAVFRSHEAMTSPKLTHSCLKLKRTNVVVSQESENTQSNSLFNCLDSDFFEQIQREAAKQTEAFIFRNNVSLSSPKLTRLCLVPTVDNSAYDSPQDSIDIASSSYLKQLEKDLLHHIRKIAAEKAKTIVLRHEGVMTSPKHSRSCLLPTSQRSMHTMSQDSYDTTSPSYMQSLEKELFDKIRKAAAEQTTAIIIRNIEAMTSPRFTSSCFGTDQHYNLNAELGCLDCDTDVSYNLAGDKY